MDWRDHITSSPKVLGGKPAVKGTRLAVDFVLGLFASGWTAEQVLENYPSLNQQLLQAVFAYAADVTQESTAYPLPATSA